MSFASLDQMCYAKPSQIVCAPKVTTEPTMNKKNLGLNLLVEAAQINQYADDEKRALSDARKLRNALTQAPNEESPWIIAWDIKNHVFIWMHLQGAKYKRYSRGTLRMIAFLPNNYMIRYYNYACRGDKKCKSCLLQNKRKCTSGRKLYTALKVNGINEIFA